jgi:hypothetical protein
MPQFILLTIALGQCEVLTSLTPEIGYEGPARRPPTLLANLKTLAVTSGPSGSII